MDQTDKVKGCWIKVNNEDARNLYPSSP